MTYGEVRDPEGEAELDARVGKGYFWAWLGRGDMVHDPRGDFAERTREREPVPWVDEWDDR